MQQMYKARFLREEMKILSSDSAKLHAYITLSSIPLWVDTLYYISICSVLPNDDKHGCKRIYFLDRTSPVANDIQAYFPHTNIDNSNNQNNQSSNKKGWKVSVDDDVKKYLITNVKENGKLIHSTQYHDNRKQGEEEHFSWTGQKTYFCTWAADKKDGEEIYYEDGEETYFDKNMWKLKKKIWKHGVMIGQAEKKPLFRQNST